VSGLKITSLIKSKIEIEKNNSTHNKKYHSNRRMGDTCSACNSATTTDEIKIQVDGNKDKIMAELNH
jgi:hypothetical protein